MLGIFQTNAKGYPVLSRRHQEVIKKFFRHGVPFILEVKGSPEEPTTLCYYRQYIMNLYQKYQVVFLKYYLLLRQVEKY